MGRIWKNAAWLGVAPLGLNVVSLVSAGLIARALGTDEFGKFSVGSAVVGLTAPIADWGLRAIAVRQLSRAGAGANRALSDLLSLRVFLSVISTIVTIIIAFVVSAKSGLGPVILITTLTIFPVTISGTLSDGLMARNRAREISRSTLWAGVLLTVASVIAALRWHSATALAAAYVIGPVVNVLLLARHSRAEYGPTRWRWRPKYWRTLLHRAAPFFRIGILSMIIGRADTIVVSAMFGHSMAGVYAAATSLAERLGILVDSVASAVLPTLTRLRGEPRKLEEVLAQVMYPLVAILTGGAIMAVAAATPIVVVVFGEAYAAGGPALAVGLVLLPVSALDVLLSEGFLAIRRDEFVVRTGVRAQLTTLILLPVLPMLVGMLGARLARIGTFTSVFSRIAESRRVFEGLWDRVRLARLLNSVFWSLPLAIVLTVVPMPPLASVVLALGGFGVWALYVTTQWGVGPRSWGLFPIAEPVEAPPPPPPMRWTAETPAATGRRIQPDGSVRGAGTHLKVTVVIACYNAEATIAETIESILAQKRPADEIVIADDLSTDSSREIIARYPSVKLVVQERNGGPASSRNLAIRSSTGDVVAIIDADDLWYPEHLSATLGLLERFPECGFAFSGNERFGRVVDSRIPNFPPAQPVNVLDALLPGNQIPLLTVVFRRSLYDECGGFDETMRYCEDYDLWLRFGLRTMGVSTGAITAAYRTHAGQLNTHLPQMFAGTWQARLKLLEEVRATHPAQAAALHNKLGEVWARGLYTAWVVRSRESLNVMFGLSHHFPMQRTAERKWRTRATFWQALVLTDRLSKMMPRKVRDALRRGLGIAGTPRPSI